MKLELQLSFFVISFLTEPNCYDMIIKACLCLRYYYYLSDKFIYEYGFVQSDNDVYFFTLCLYLFEKIVRRVSN